MLRIHEQVPDLPVGVRIPLDLHAPILILAVTTALVALPRGPERWLLLLLALGVFGYAWAAAVNAWAGRRGVRIVARAEADRKVWPWIRQHWPNWILVNVVWGCCIGLAILSLAEDVFFWDIMDVETAIDWRLVLAATTIGCFIVLTWRALRQAQLRRDAAGQV